MVVLVSERNSKVVIEVVVDTRIVAADLLIEVVGMYL